MSLTKHAIIGAAMMAIMVSAGESRGLGQTPAGAQRPAPGTAPAGEVVGHGNYSPIVQDLDKAVEFYVGLLGIAVPPQTPGPWAFQNDPRLMAMFGMPGAQLRVVTPRIPGAPIGVEMVELKDIDRKPVRPRPQDPGGATLVLLVRDVNAAFAPLKRAKVPVVTPGGEPIALGANNRARGVIVSDPDGHFVELLQPDPLPETTAAPESNIIGARLRMTVADTDQTVHVYRDLLQFQPQVGAFGASPLLDLMGLKGAQLRMTSAQVPGSTLRMEFVEVKGVDRTPVQPRLQDPGATRLQVRVRDLDSTIAKLKSSGAKVISTGGEPATLQGGLRAGIIPDPNGLFLVLIHTPPRNP